MDWKDATELTCYNRVVERVMLLTYSFLDCAELLLIFLTISYSVIVLFEPNFMKQPDFPTKCMLRR